MDIFDKIMSLPILKIFYPFYSKHKQVLLYIFFGGLTTVISIVTFWALDTPLGVNEHVANVISWIAAVLFAFLTNRVMVFNAKTKSALDFIRQMLTFYAGRVATLLMEELIILLFITICRFNSLVVKISAQVLVMILNYIISKFFIFKNKG